MSGIAGIVRLDGAPLSDAALERVAQAIAHRGPDGSGIWSNGPAGLAQAMLHTTAESRDEAQPFVNAHAFIGAQPFAGAPLTVDAGSLAIVADARLDNRAELLYLLGISNGNTGDAALILAAYRAWGAGCVPRLEGDFAFAILDERERMLFCARDPFGVKPFVYALVPGRLFAFGSEVRALLAVDEIPCDADEKRIADFLALYFDDNKRTFHRAIQRLPGGCTLTLRDGVATVRRYWDPRAVRALPRWSDAQYADGFREHFTRAVRDRMRAADPSHVGAMLSGGLDSTSIACVARDELRAAGAAPLPVFSWIFSDSMESDEREFQQAVLAHGGLQAFTLDSAVVDASPWTDLAVLLPDGPPYAPNYYLNSGAAKAARGAGVKVILDGLGGDSTISRGSARLVELFLHGKAFTLARELRALAARRGTRESLPRLFVSHVAAPLAPPWLLRLNLRLRRRDRSGDPGLSLLTPRARELSGAARHHPRVFLSAREEHLAQFEAPLLAEGLELFDRVMALFGVEGRYPFFDRRLAEYCISLPADQKLADGYSRIVARRAMEGILPPEVQWRAGKGKPGLHIIPALRASRAVLDDLFVRDPSVLAPYADVGVLRRMYTDLLERPRADLRVAIRLWSAATLGQWLRTR